VTSDIQLDAAYMARALELASHGEGYVEPNPMAGCVVVQGGEVVGEGWHQKFGGPHAEVEALRVAGARARGATMYVTLEPCCHHGKTPPCTGAIIAAGIARVVCAQRDPFEQVAGKGIETLKAAGIDVDIGTLAAEAKRLNAPYLKLVTTGRPWIIAKWAMTLDGKIATRTGDSRWVSGEASREIVHRLRGRADGIMVGRGTLERDDPLLTARPPGARVATRIVVDSCASLAMESRLVRSVSEAPVLIAAGSDAPQENIGRLTTAGCTVVICRPSDHSQKAVSIRALLDELGRRRMTNVLVEGGSQLLGSLFDEGAVDEIHVFISPKVIGGSQAPTAIAGMGLEKIALAARLDEPEIRQVGDDLYVRGRMVSNRP
jgi:diaminohydroxyphosphoribosylaminopyrimidine deaminase/5-amino-6-(5-phosphoribosylamino)uracil reductase